MLKRDISKTYYQKLLCQVYILGAATEGESILFIVYGDDKVIYSCIVDSFMINNVNVPKEKLQALGLECVTDVIWTHPHDDHSEGLCDLIKIFKPESVYIPSDLQKLPDKTPQISKNTLEILNTYRSCNRRYKYQPCIIDIGSNYTLLEKKLKVSGTEVPFSIYSIAPAVGKVRRDVITNNYSNPNNFSIAISIIIGDFVLLLTGDIQDSMITYIPDDLQKDFYTPNLLKIPHHGSDGSLKIMSLFEFGKQVDIAVTTNKKLSKLPKAEALKHYSSYCNKIYQISSDAEGLAVWGVEIDILNATITEIERNNYMIYVDPETENC